MVMGGGMFGFGDIAKGGASGTEYGGSAMPAAAPIGSILRAVGKRRADREKREAERQRRNEAVYGFGRAQDAFDTQRELAGSLGGQLTTDYLPADMLMKGDREQIGGGALETILNLSGGYNPAVAANPAMGVFASDRAAMQGLESSAKANTEQTLSEWERTMADLASTYEDQRGAAGAERDRVRGEFTEAVEEDKAEQEEDLARHIVEQWIDSNSSKGALGNEDFLDRRGGEWRNRRGRGKVLGADEKAKREYIRDQLASGMTYQELLTDPDVLMYVTADPSTASMAEQYLVDQGMRRNVTRSEREKLDGSANFDLLR